MQYLKVRVWKYLVSQG